MSITSSTCSLPVETLHELHTLKDAWGLRNVGEVIAQLVDARRAELDAILRSKLKEAN